MIVKWKKGIKTQEPKTMKTKKAGQYIVIALLLVVMSHMTIGYVSAGNTGDNIMDMDFQYADETWDTALGYKQNNSSMRMMCNYTNFAGSSFRTWAMAYEAKPTGGHWECDVSKGNVYTLYEGTTRYILNWVREGGFLFGFLRSTPHTFHGGTTTFKGLWSPDSI